MLGSTVLEVGIGLILTFLMFSLVLTSAKEGIESFLKGRATDLEATIGELLGDGTGTGIVKSFYHNPMIFPLFQGVYNAAKKTNLPSYIPKENFAAAVTWLVQAPETAGSIASALPENSPARQVYNSLSAEAGATAASIKQGIEAWYVSAMDRLTGLYKRKAQLWLFVLGFVVAALGNVDPINIGNRLANDERLRANVVALAPIIQKNADIIAPTKKPPQQVDDGKNKSTESHAGAGGASGTHIIGNARAADTTAQTSEDGAIANNATGNLQAANMVVEVDETTPGRGDPTNINLKLGHDISGELSQAGLPIGWGKNENIIKAICAGSGDDGLRYQWLSMIAGWFIAALAGMLGAPFWFDQLNRVMNLRAALKPDQKKSKP